MMSEPPASASPLRFARFNLTTLFVLVAGVAAAIVAWHETSKTDVTATLRVNRSVNLIATPGPTKEMTEAEYRRFCQTQVELLRSDYVLTRALRNPTVGATGFAKLPDAATWLKENLKIGMKPDTEVLQVTLRTFEPEEAAKLVNAVVDAYFKEVVETDRQDRLRHEDQLKRLYQEKEDEITREMQLITQVAHALGTTTENADELQKHPDLRVKLLHLKVQEELLEDLQRAMHQMNLDRHSPPRIQEMDKARAP